MKKRNLIALAIIVEGCIVSFTGCRDDSASNRTDAETLYGQIENETENKTENETDNETENKAENETENKAENETKIETESETESMTSDNAETDAMYINVPKLHEQGSKLDDFVPEKWEIIDSVELDYNKDGITDYVGVLETESVGMEASPRILFAIASDKADSYHLDFQNADLIRRSDEGGVFGDPYMPMTAEGAAFTTHAYGGSAWRWSEDYTYAFRDNAWWCISSEWTYGYMDYIVSYSKDDWEKGIGIRKKRSDAFEDMEEHPDNEEYDVEYEIPLDEPLTIEQAGARWWLAPEHITDWEVETISFGEGIELAEDRVMLPGDAFVYDYDANEGCILYKFSNDNVDYIAMYSRNDKSLSVLAKEDAGIDGLELYKGKIYYSAEIKEDIAQTTTDGNKQKTQKAAVGVGLYRIEPDAAERETIFEYRYPNEQEIKENKIPYMSLGFEIGRDEIVIQVYIGSNPNLYYRVNTDGSGLEEIGEM